MPIQPPRLIAVVPCGARKQAVKAPAVDLYTGSYFRANLAYARSRVEDRNVYILSAMHGLVPAAKELAPYNLKMGQQGCVDRARVANQISALGLAEATAIVLGGASYRALATGQFGREEFVIDAMRRDGIKTGMGSQMAWLIRNSTRRTD